MIRIYLSFFGNLIRCKSDKGEKEQVQEISPETSLADLIVRLGISRKEVQLIRCNDKPVNLDYIPREGDRIKFYSLMSGG